MAAVPRKLSAFRQLSLTCDDRRKSFKKQFSEEVVIKEKPRPRIAWADSNPSTPKQQEGIIVKKCIKEAKKTFSRHGSLEKESILYSKKELAERLRQALKDREQERPNLNIFLAHNTTANAAPEEDGFEESEATTAPPKIMPPLLTAPNVFQIRKTKEPCSPKSGAMVVIPIVEREPDDQDVTSTPPPATDRADPKAIKNIIIRPSTAAAKRERFQKRTNTAFNSTVISIKEGRPPLVRSSSAPTKPSEPAKPKFLATKRRIKSGKRSAKEDGDSGSNKENPKNKKEMNRYVPIIGSDIVTMVSLISPAASDNEEVEIEKPKVKNSPVKSVKKEEKEIGGKSMSLRKTVKSVTFQQSSIHAIRSFSASFPARRGSMATALMLGSKGQKNQEKRATNSTTPDDDERGPKRRLVKSAVDKTKKSTEDDEDSPKINEKEAAISVEIKNKKIFEEDGDEHVEVTEVAEVKSETDEQEEERPQFGSAKEKECWDMYCKMADKGLKVSYDTILRGMLTPTEYRMRRKESIVNVEDDAKNAQN